MKTTIDKAGRVVIPKPIRDAFGLQGGEELDVERCNGMIEIRRVPVENELIRTEDGFLTFRHSLGLTSTERVREAIDEVRERRL